MPALYEQTLEYVELDEGLEVSFRRRSGVTLSDVGIFSTSLHRMLNKTAGRLIGISPYPIFDPESELPEPFFRPPFYDPLLVQAFLTDLSYESFSAKTRLRIQRILRDFTIGVGASIVATLLTNCYQSHPQNTKTEGKNIPEVHPAKVDVGRNLATMTERLSRAGGDWELHLKDTKTGAEIRIRHNE